MTRLANHLLILFLLFNAAAALAVSQTARVISRIEFEGLQKIAAEDALATSGLRVDQSFKIEDVDSAAQRLLDSGIFKQVGYRTRTAANKVTITFQVEEASGGESPVIFDNFIWFSDDQLMEAVRREVPLFAGRAPNEGKTPEAIARALQQLLTDQKISGTVEYLATQDLAGRVLAHVFSVKGLKMPICAISFPGTQNLSEAKLASIAKELSDTDYSSELVRGFAGMKLIAAYREVGQLRAVFAPPVAKPDPRCKNGAAVTLPVNEGLIYSLRRTDWTGANALTADQLNALLGMKPGEVANGLKFDRGLIDVQKAYGRQGYIEAQTSPTPEFDDNERKVTYKVEIREGPQYRMGSLLFKGLGEKDARALRGAWRLKRGEVFDQGYLEEFFKHDAASVIHRLIQERSSVGQPPPRLDTNIKINKGTLTVDVTLELAN